MADDDWLQDFNKAKPKPVEVRPVEKPQVAPEPVREAVLREPPPSLVHTNSQTQYVFVSTEIHPVLKFPDWVIERLNYLFLSKPYVVLIACDPGAARMRGSEKISGYGLMRAMGRREVEVSWLRLWSMGVEEMEAKHQIKSTELQKCSRGTSVYEETANLHGRGICRLLDKLVFNSTDADYMNEREIIFGNKKSRLSRRFQDPAELRLVNATYEEYLQFFEQGGSASSLLPSLRAIH